MAAVVAEAKTPSHSRGHDALLAHISTSDELALKVRTNLTTEGYAVVPGVFTREECAAQIDLLWRFVEALNSTVKREDPDTWYPQAGGSGSKERASDRGDRGQLVDPWPHTGWKSFSDMFQSHQAGWLFSDLREVLAERVFGKVSLQRSESKP